MGRIRVDMDSLRNFGNALNNRINEFAGIVSQVDALNNSIMQSWEGDAKTAYNQMASSFAVRQQELKDILGVFKGYAMDTSVKFEEMDAACASRIRNSF